MNQSEEGIPAAALRTRPDVEARLNAKACKELEDALARRQKGGAAGMISTRAAAVFLGCSTKMLELRRRDGEGWDTPCADTPFRRKVDDFRERWEPALREHAPHRIDEVRQVVVGGANQRVRYDLDCLLESRPAAHAKPTPFEIGPDGLRIHGNGPKAEKLRAMLGFTTFEEAFVDDYWVLDERDAVIERAVSVSDSDLHRAIDEERVWEGTLADVLLHADWVSLDTRRAYQRLLTGAFDDGVRRVQARVASHELQVRLAP